MRLEQPANSSAARRGLSVRWLCPGSQRRYVFLDRAKLTLGRGRDVDVPLESVGVSRVHAEISRQGSVYVLSDRRSKNGTFLNGRPIQHSALSDGDVLRLGDMVGVVLRAPPQRADDERDWVEPIPSLFLGPGLHDQLEELRRFAATPLPVVLVGETGTGKDCLARATHVLSGRRGALQAVNCAALPSGLAEAELFGHKRGAFTGAVDASLGHLRAAHEGTLFLDEFGELPLLVQAKLLRALQDGSIQPLGETRSSQVDVRVIVACQEPLEALVSTGRLRADLAERLNGLALTLPPLRKRRVDIGLLFGHFLRSHSGGREPAVESRLLEKVLLRDWPGNVRELELCVKKLLLVHGHEQTLKSELLPDSLHVVQSPGLEARPAESRDEQDLKQLELELERSGGNLARAATKTGISRQRAYRLLKARRRTELSNEDSGDGAPS
jgi:transcriptional regulator of acetoin/glycerol metabolism